ncbi:MAG: hypothetical protein H0U74_08545 [Bradymonadaceae bacterium]|nr:hypothetical protein [Lujinxingiaceae bacterium]
MEPDLHEEISQFRRDGALAVLLHGSRHLSYRIVVAFFVLGSLAHLWLADAWEWDWLVSNLVFLAGLALLLWRGAALGWLLCALAKLISLLFLRDQLTQSMVLLFFGMAGFVFMAYDGWRATRSPRGAPTLETSYGALSSGEASFFDVFRAITVLVYALAALHKLNRDFIDPTLSCASYGLQKLAHYWHVELAALPETLVGASPSLVLATEIGIVALFLCGLRRAAWWLAVAFHIPLTLTMAPAYAFVMLAGHAAFARPDDIAAIQLVLSRFWGPIAAVATLLTALSLYRHGRWPEASMVPKEWLLWALLATLSLLIARHGLARYPLKGRLRFRPAPALIVLLFALNGLSPYLGLRFHHTGAMVSNLRIDEGCWNSLIFSERMRISEDYVRVDFTYMREPGFMPTYERIVLEQLWSPPQIRQMRRNWCKQRLRPFYLEGTFRGQGFAIEDLCDDQRLPFGADGVFGIELFEDSLRFQKNLMRQCPKTCIH